MIAETGIEELRRLNDNLKKLLDNPEPGLFMWRYELNKTIKQIAAFAGEADGQVATPPQAPPKRKRS